MAWEYEPKDASDCLEDGTYDASLVKVVETTSKKGNPMLVLEWEIARPDRTRTVIDYIVQPSGMFKYKQIAQAWGMLYEFTNKQFQVADHIGKLICVDLKTQVDETGKYPDRNTVKGYMAPDFAPHNNTGTVPFQDNLERANELAAQSADSDIPF